MKIEYKTQRDQQTPASTSMSKNIFSPGTDRTAAERVLEPGVTTRGQQLLSGVALAPVAELVTRKPSRKRTQSSDNEDEPNKTRRSTPSLDWDEHLEPPVFNNPRRCSLTYNYTVGSEGSGYPGSNLSFVAEDDTEDVFQEALDDQEAENVAPANMAAGNRVDNAADAEEALLQNKATIEMIEWTIGDDIRIVNVELVERTFLVRRMEQAEELKEKLREASKYILVHDTASYNADYKQQTADMRKELAEFVVKAQERLTVMNNEARAESNTPRNMTERAQAATREIKALSVTNYYATAVAEMKALENSLTELKFDPELDQMGFRKEEQYERAISKKIEVAKADAQRLRSDAVDAGLVEAADALEKGIREMNKKANVVADNLLHQRRSRNLLSVSGTSSTQRGGDVLPPEFGAASSMDYFKFTRELKEYKQVKMPSNEELVRVLLTRCLKGEALVGCEHMTTEEEIMGYLKRTFGDEKILINQTLAEIKKLGNCTGDDSKKKSWLLMTKTKLMYAKSLATTQVLQDELYHSRIAVEVQNRMPGKLLDDFLLHLEAVDTTGALAPNKVYDELVTYMEKLITRFTYRLRLGTRLNEVEIIGERRVPPAEMANRQQGNRQQSRRNFNVDGEQHSDVFESFPNGGCCGSGGCGSQSRGSGNYSVTARPEKCRLCSDKHTYLYYCPIFQKANFEDRFDLARKAGNCFRCLVVSTCVDFDDRRAWFEQHKRDCDTEWWCQQGKCATKEKSKQMSFLLCLWHARKNVETEARFIRSLDKNEMRGNSVKFLFNVPMLMNWTYTAGPANPIPGWSVLPDVSEPSIFMMSYILIDNVKFLTFFDSGCMTASVSQRVCNILKTQCMRKGPSEISVAGGKTFPIPGGDERFSIPLADGKTRCTVTALCMPRVTTPFPVWETGAAFHALEQSYRADYPMGPELPVPPDKIGGCQVDIMLGIKYLRWFPQHVYM